MLHNTATEIPSHVRGVPTPVREAHASYIEAARLVTETKTARRHALQELEQAERNQAHVDAHTLDAGKKLPTGIATQARATVDRATRERDAAEALYATRAAAYIAAVREHVDQWRADTDVAVDAALDVCLAIASELVDVTATLAETIAVRDALNTFDPRKGAPRFTPKPIERPGPTPTNAETMIVTAAELALQAAHPTKPEPQRSATIEALRLRPRSADAWRLTTETAAW